jgi:hypothetical protein
MATNTFRTKYRTLTEEEKHRLEQIKMKAEELEALFEMDTPSRFKSLALTNLEQSVMWIVKEVTKS